MNPIQFDDLGISFNCMFQPPSGTKFTTGFVVEPWVLTCAYFFKGASATYYILGSVWLLICYGLYHGIHHHFSPPFGIIFLDICPSILSKSKYTQEV